MKDAVIVYASVHHGNTKKLVDAIAEKLDVDIMDAVSTKEADLSSYSKIGFASGIYFGKFHRELIAFARKNLPEDKKIFFLCTYGSKGSIEAFEREIADKRPEVIGFYGCKGYDSFGPFKLVGGINKNKPGREEILGALEFAEKLLR